MSRKQAAAADGENAAVTERKAPQRKGSWAVLESNTDGASYIVVQRSIATRDDAFTVAAPLAVEGKQVAIALIIPLKVKAPKIVKPTVRLG